MASEKLLNYTVLRQIKRYMLICTGVFYYEGRHTTFSPGLSSLGNLDNIFNSGSACHISTDMAHRNHRKWYLDCVFYQEVWLSVLRQLLQGSGWSRAGESSQWRTDIPAVDNTSLWQHVTMDTGL